MARRRWLILMDLDDTLMPTNYRYIEASWRCGMILSRALGFKSPYPLDIARMEFEIDRELGKEYGFKIDRFPLSWVKTYERLCEEYGMEPDGEVSALLTNTASRFRYGPFQPFKGVKAVLEKLRRQGHELHLVTLGDTTLQRRKLDQTGLAGEFTSVRIVEREKKLAMQELLKERGGAALMIGDSKLKDILPANELGMVTVWIPSQTKSPKDGEIKPDFTIRSFSEVLGIMGKLDAALARKKRK